MKIKVNGLEKEIPSAGNLKQIIEQFCRQKNNVIAEVNGEIVRSPDWADKKIQNGDAIELVNFVGGG